MNGYSVGERPPGLAEDGSFETSIGVRAHSIVDNETGRTLSVDKSTGVLVEDEESDG